MPIPQHIDPQNWQNYYTEKQAYRDSLRKSGQLLVPIIIGIVPPMLLLLIYTGSLMENAITTADLIWRGAIGGTLIITLIMFTALCIKYQFKSAATFLENFHNLSNENNVKQLVRLRVFGTPPFPPPLSNLFKFPAVTLKDGKLDPHNHWSTIVGGPAKLNIAAGHALYLERGGYFSRVVGQGFAFLGWDERISAAVNVGPRNETISVTAWTKDGIKITVNAKGEYFLGHARGEDDENVLIPFDPESIRKAVEHAFKSGKEAHEWLKSATRQTHGILGAYISNHFLDDLFLKDNNNFTLLSNTNVSDLLNTINSRLQEYGVYLSNFQIIEIMLPEKVKQQRIKIWETNYVNFAVITDGEVKAHQIRMREKVRAETQRDLLFTIANGLDRIDDANFPEPLFLSISALLDRSMKDPLVRANLAKESLEILEKIQESIKFPIQLSGEET